MSPRMALRAAWRRRWFPERQIILRQQDTVRAIRVSARTQLVAACLVVIGGGWTAAATATHLAALLPSAPQGEAPAPRPHAGGSDAAAAAPMLDTTLAATAQRLEEAQAERRAALRERDTLAARLADAEKRLHATAVEHEQALARLTRETRRSIGEVERIIAAAGIDPARLVPQAGHDGHRGGPFVPWRGQTAATVATPPLADAVASDIAQLDRLLPLLRTMPLSAPVRGFSITSLFGHRTDPFNGQEAMHDGLDLQAPLHARVAATAPGRVVFAGRRGGYGLMVEVEHGYGIHTRYAHLDRISTSAGARVERGQVLGLLGETGRATGPHLHYEVLVDGRTYDPLNFLKAASNVRKND